MDLFRARTDVFALHWERGGKSGYLPAYQFDSYQYRLHKIKGGTWQNFSNKTHLQLTPEQIYKHLNGEQFIGVYPLLEDNTSWFIAADFDGGNWTDEARLFLNSCLECRLYAYLERSRSGNGGHVWVFFAQPYPAYKSRKIFHSLALQCGIISILDKANSFDRFFPSQDSLSGKGFGNLIALPFNKDALEKGNCCFINPDSLNPYEDQTLFFRQIQRISEESLNRIFNNLVKPGAIQQNDNAKNRGSDKLQICLTNAIEICRQGLPGILITFLQDELNFVNTEYIIKKKLGKNAHNTEKYFRFFEETETHFIIPRGMTGRLLRFCNTHQIPYDFSDKRVRLENIEYQFNAVLYEHQQSTIDNCQKKDFGVIVAPPGTGKTVIGLKIIADRQQPALIIVHRKQLADQWIEKIQTFLGIPKSEIGIIGQGKSKPGTKVTVGLIQSLVKSFEKPDKNCNHNAFGTVIIDECHHVPAETYRNFISRLSCCYLYGLTATPFRKYNNGKLIFIHLGDVIAEIKPQEIGNYRKATIIIRNTGLDIPFNSKTDRFETIAKILVHDSARNKLILDDIITEVKSGKRAVIITERKEHIDTLNQYLKQSLETITLSGEDSEVSRNTKWKLLKDGNFQVLITTGQYFGEGSDLKYAGCLFLAFPFSFKGKLIQYIGRVQRSEISPVIYDYRDIKIEYLNRLFLRRNTYYRKLENQATLFDEEGVEVQTTEKTWKYHHTIQLSFDRLDFQYGSLAFKHLVKERNCELVFEIENDSLRPEFEVLKPYFSKVIKKQFITIDVEAEFDGDNLISQSAISKDIERINREVIDSVKFRFLTKHILQRKIPPATVGNLYEMNTLLLSANEDQSLYSSENDFLNDLMKSRNSKHGRQLKYLANRHDLDRMKIHFVLDPFSFLFLLTGEEQFHLVLETFDTEEATYIWHVNKNNTSLSEGLKDIKKDLLTIRTGGRISFLEKKRDSFSRIMHDYSDEKKGFIFWKDMLEERLV